MKVTMKYARAVTPTHHRHTLRNYLSMSVAGLILLASTVAHAQYDRTLGDTFFGQEKNYYCGPATARMILSGDTVNVTPLPSQDTLYTKIQATNGTVAANGNFYTSPDGLKGALSFYDPNHTYVAYNIANYDSAVRTLAYNIDHYSVTGGALINNGGHWINVVGVDTSVKPALNTAFKVNGFYIKDPWSGFMPGKGLGKNSYYANTAEGWKKYFTTTNYGGKYQGNYAFVTDPDPDTDTADSSFNFTPTSIANATQADSEAALDLSNIAGLAGDASFENGSFGLAGATEVNFSDGAGEWLVPYYQTGATTASGTVLINATTGTLDQAFWDEGVLTGDSLSAVDSLVQNEASNQLILDNVVPEPTTLLGYIVGGLTLTALCKARHSRKS